MQFVTTFTKPHHTIGYYDTLYHSVLHYCTTLYYITPYYTTSDFFIIIPLLVCAVNSEPKQTNKNNKWNKQQNTGYCSDENTSAWIV